MKESSELPILYSCSGCSSAAQLANRISVHLDRTRKVNMSCIAGVGGGVSSLVRVAKSGKKIITIDGCQLQCAVQCLKRHNLKPDLSITLSDFDIKKEFHTDCDENDFQKTSTQIELQVERLISSS